MRLTVDTGVMPFPKSEYTAKEVCERLRIETAQVIGRYDSEFYAGEPFATINSFGAGKVYYVGCTVEDGFIEDS